MKNYNYRVGADPKAQGLPVDETGFADRLEFKLPPDSDDPSDELLHFIPNPPNLLAAAILYTKSPQSGLDYIGKHPKESYSSIITESEPDGKLESVAFFVHRNIEAAIVNKEPQIDIVSKFITETTGEDVTRDTATKAFNAADACDVSFKYSLPDGSYTIFVNQPNQDTKPSQSPTSPSSSIAQALKDDCPLEITIKN